MEANSKNYRMQEQNVVRRPPGITKAVRGAACPASPNGTQQFINITKAAGAVSGNPLEMEKGQLNRYFHTSEVSAVPVESVPCMPMEAHLSMLKDNKSMENTKKHVDFFSLDVEGAELTVLSTIDFKQTQVDVLSIELHLANKEAPACRELLEKNGFYECDFLRELTVLASFVFVHQDSNYTCPQRATWGIEGPEPSHFERKKRKRALPIDKKQKPKRAMAS